MRYLITILLLSSFVVQGQIFVEQDLGLQNVHDADAAFGDYDNDGDIDLLLLGGDTQPSTTLYENVDGSFVATSQQILNVAEGAAAFGDYDGDGDLDFVIAGRDELGKYCTVLYNNSEGAFSPIPAPFVGAKDLSLTWNDFDNDNDLDLMLSGNDGSQLERFSQLYRNDGSAGFIATSDLFKPSRGTSCAWADVDNDGDQDLLISGDGDFIEAFLYRNVDGSFIEEETDITGAFDGRVIWRELNGDYSLDLIVVGNNEYLESEGTIYENFQGALFFQSNQLMIDGAALGSLDGADYDNDGDQDLMVCGKGSGCGLVLSHLFENRNSYFLWQNEGFEQIHKGTCLWGDVDNDGFADILLSGTNGYGEAYSRIWHNELGGEQVGQNTPPTAPENLSVVLDQSEGEVYFYWDMSDDQQTPSEGLTYNLRVGTTPSGNEVLASMSLEDGFRLVPEIGNVNHSTGWMLKGLEPGIYYWSVQAVDAGMIGSAFSEEGTFEFGPVAVASMNSDAALSIYPNPAQDQLFLKCNQYREIQIFDRLGRLLLEQKCTKGVNTINIDYFNPGYYFLRSGVVTQQFVKL